MRTRLVARFAAFSSRFSSFSPVAPVALFALFALASLGLALAGCGGMSGGGYSYLPPDTPGELDGLRLVRRDADFDRQYLKPEVDFTHYRALYVAPLQLVYTEAYQREHQLDRWREDERMVPQARIDAYHQADLERLNALFRGSLERRLVAGSGYRLSDEPGPGVLALAGEVIDLDLRSAHAGYLELGSSAWVSAPVVILAAQIRDGHSGERLAEIIQAHSNAGSHLESAQLFWDDVSDALDQWADDLRVMLHRHSPGLGDGE